MDFVACKENDSLINGTSDCFIIKIFDFLYGDTNETLKVSDNNDCEEINTCSCYFNVHHPFDGNRDDIRSSKSHRIQIKEQNFVKLTKSGNERTPNPNFFLSVKETTILELSFVSYADQILQNT